MLIHSWLDSGCTHKDILTAMQEMMQRNKNITSIAYFGPRVFRERDNRIELESAKAAKAKPIASQFANTDDERAHTLRFKLKVFKYLNARDEAWLAAYETKNGPHISA